MFHWTLAILVESISDPFSMSSSTWSHTQPFICCVRLHDIVNKDGVIKFKNYNLIIIFDHTGMGGGGSTVKIG